MAYIATINEKKFQVEVEEPEPGRYQVRVNDDNCLVDFFEAQENIYSLIIDHQSYEVDIDQVERGSYSVMIKGDHFDVQIVDEKTKRLAETLSARAVGRQGVKSPMAGNIWRLLKSQGEIVKQGEVLIILEAMKMENEIRSPIDGFISSMCAVEGTAVSAGALLCMVDPVEK